jgi:hypothetical protein
MTVVQLLEKFDRIILLRLIDNPVSSSGYRASNSRMIGEVDLERSGRGLIEVPNLSEFVFID